MHDAKVKHNQIIVEQFSQQAIPFAKKSGHSDSMHMLIEMSGVSGEDQVLDVACGPGLVACAFAPHARHVTGIDITPAMIEQARRLQDEKQLENLTWQVGDVLPLPFPGDSFSVVLTRYSLHHFLASRSGLGGDGAGLPPGWPGAGGGCRLAARESRGLQPHGTTARPLPYSGPDLP